jgi:V-type H+-transporting ATPase subunit H
MIFIGEFSRFYANGRTVAKSLGGKDIAIGLIEHGNADIQRQALQCISKLMISNWDHMR